MDKKPEHRFQSAQDVLDTLPELPLPDGTRAEPAWQTCRIEEEIAFK